MKRALKKTIAHLKDAVEDSQETHGEQGDCSPCCHFPNFQTTFLAAVEFMNVSLYDIFRNGSDD
jgi:hypothetical protein